MKIKNLIFAILSIIILYLGFIPSHDLIQTLSASIFIILLILLIAYFKNLSKKTKKIIIIVLIALLIIPHRINYQDGGTKTYTALAYKVIDWNQLDSFEESNDGEIITINGKNNIEFYIFPFNFKSLDEYK